MSHTSQRRGLEKYRGGKEIIVLAMAPPKYENKEGIAEAMSELALKMLDHGPVNWLSRNFTEIAIPEIGVARRPLELLARRFPGAIRRMLLESVSRRSSVLTAVYSDPGRVTKLINEIKGSWLSRNREKGLPISIVLSGMEGDVRSCCRKTGLTEHTYLHSMGFFGRAEALPGEDELSLMTMCGHGLIAVRLIRQLAARIGAGEMTPEIAANEMAKPCVCGIVNMERAAEIFKRLAGR